MQSEARLALAVVGAHLSGQPLNHELTELGATLHATAKTAACYRLFALETQPAKPGLLRVVADGQAIEVEVWSLPLTEAGGFLQRVSAPLCLGQLELSDGSRVHGFLCEHHATLGARDITEFGSWRAYLGARGA